MRQGGRRNACGISSISGVEAAEDQLGIAARMSAYVVVTWRSSSAQPGNAAPKMITDHSGGSGGSPAERHCLWQM